MDDLFTCIQRTYSHDCNTKFANETPQIVSDSLRHATEIVPDKDRRKCEAAIAIAAAKFTPFIERTASCWLWTRGLDAHGYGQINVPGFTPIRSNRLAWMLKHGPIASCVHVLHRCDVRRCVNPDHLFLGDQDANMKDAAAKGRLHVARPNRRRLSSDEMAAILAAPQVRGVVVRLARQYGVTKAYVSLLRRGLRRWRKAA